MRRGTGISERGSVNVRGLFGMELRETLYGCMNLIRANYVIAPFLERIPWPLIQVRMFIDCQEPSSEIISRLLKFFIRSIKAISACDAKNIIVLKYDLLSLIKINQIYVKPLHIIDVLS